jgi:anti-anti-sigma factor
MALTHTMYQKGQTLTVSLSGDVVYSENPTFRRIVDDVVVTGATAVKLDMSGLRSVDSAGLSMLVLLQDRIVSSGGTLTLNRPSAQVARILEVVAFDKLFTIVA